MDSSVIYTFKEAKQLEDYLKSGRLNRHKRFCKTGVIKKISERLKDSERDLLSLTMQVVDILEFSPEMKSFNRGEIANIKKEILNSLIYQEAYLELQRAISKLKDPCYKSSYNNDIIKGKKVKRDVLHFLDKNHFKSNMSNWFSSKV